MWYNFDMGNNLSLLTEDIKKAVINGVITKRKNADIIKELGISEATYYYWIRENLRGIRDQINEAKKSLVLSECEEISQEIRDLSVIDDNGRANPRLLAIKQKEIEFLRETLGKDMGYSKRLETIGLNINKNEPLDPDQKAKLDKLVKAVDLDSVKHVEVIEVDQNNGYAEPL
jgi:ACT domain-containing protein